METIAQTHLEIASFDGVILSGTLTTPVDPIAVVIPIHGSFNQDRDGNLDGTSKWMYPEGVPKRNLFLDISQFLATKNVASYRYDKRASAKSGGIYQDTTLTVLAKDVVAVVATIRKRFVGIPIVLIGQSEGGLVSVKAATLGVESDAIILQNPALLPFDTIFEFQKTRAAAPFLNDPDQSLAKKYPYVSAFYRAMADGSLQKKMRETNEPTFELHSGSWRALTSLGKYREYNWDGLELLMQVKKPVDILLSSKDLNVPPDLANMISKKIEGAPDIDIKVSVLEGLEHSFREVRPGEGFFEALSKPISSLYLDTLWSSLSRRIQQRKTTSPHRSPE